MGQIISCLVCSKPTKVKASYLGRKFCSNACQCEQAYRDFIALCLKGEVVGGSSHAVSRFVA